MEEIKEQGRKLWQSLWWPALFVALLWAVQGVQELFHLNWRIYGVLPREPIGLRGVLFMPLIHKDWGHLLANTPPLYFLSAMILFFYRKVAFRAFSLIYILTGLAVWLLANMSIPFLGLTGERGFHIGASGLIYGMVAFVFWSGIFRRSIKAIALSLIVVFYYGSLFLGILPGQTGISWEGHLFGALAGILVAFWYKKDVERDDVKPKPSWETEDELPPTSFFDADIFQKTKEERRRDTF
ncbi:MAG TPA: rhomboid family intramembrane serine protease [Flavilitoribacter sp.]|nr:rhomboid family intramembrane serine protease [Flavilitoribacter sp.]HMQ87999.1 rhomboid family intramembrane serine protease [Flavilitoribacter sp.]